ncbi:probable disease resistance protein At5g66900 isoform X2 [Prosopis cineraria]|uniref:probable disease resistance protein At5g66900 isoform X2 n=1 Tax=Prosopis cineraria TaxID=364024 RepID=UPI00240F7DE0|nr:probable disease resistance protein At5g66900 isoform X2 [Prosopis cineraria]
MAEVVFLATAGKKLANEIGKELWDLIKRGPKHPETAQRLETAMELLGPLFANIEQKSREANVEPRVIEKLQESMNKIRDAHLKCSEVGWCFWLAPFYQKEMEKAVNEMKEIIEYFLPVQTAANVLELLIIARNGTSDQTNPTRRQEILIKSDLEISLPESTLELHAPLLGKLKSFVIMDGGGQILNLTGFAGSGKTTLAKQLRHDPQVRAWFRDNIFVADSWIESNEVVAEQLLQELREKGNNEAVFLVLDNFQPGFVGLVEQCMNWISSSSKSRILVISRVDIPELGTRETMTPLDEDAAIELLRHIAKPIGPTSFNLPEERILQQVVGSCGGFPLAIKVLGGDLRGRHPDIWRKKSKELSRSGDYSPSGALTYLHNSLSVLKDFPAVREFFMDLGLFPENEIIPITALSDIWAELYQDDDDGIDVMSHIRQLASMNLVDKVVQRELANKYSSEGKVLERKRLILGNDPPQGWPQQTQSWFCSFLSLLVGSTRQRTAALVLSISTDQNVTPDWCDHIQPTEAVVLVLNIFKTSDYKLPEFMKAMGNLKVLILTGYAYCFTELRNLELLASLRSLKRIRLQHVSVPSFCDLKNVTKLSFYCCQVKKAFEDSSIEFSTALPKLEDLIIEYCSDLIALPSGLCSVVSLKKLSIISCHKFTGLPQGIGRLENLELLRISYCADFENLPESITQMSRLSILDISHCVSLREIPDKIGELQNLRKLYMTGCSIHEVPDSAMKLEHLEKVICDDCTSHLWEVISSELRNLKVNTAQTDITLNWLLGSGFQGFIL